jgi:hypothetical protein
LNVPIFGEENQPPAKGGRTSITEPAVSALA